MNPVQKFTQDIGQKGGVLDQHNEYLKARAALYDNIANLATEVDNAMKILDSFNQTATQDLDNSLAEAGNVYQQGVYKAIGIGLVVVLLAAGIGYHIAHKRPFTIETYSYYTGKPDAGRYDPAN